MIHALGVANGGDYDWVDAGEPDQALLDKFEALENLSIEEILNN